MRQIIARAFRWIGLGIFGGGILAWIAGVHSIAIAVGFLLMAAGFILKPLEWNNPPY